jgi:hypothetical protein
MAAATMQLQLHLPVFAALMTATAMSAVTAVAIALAFVFRACDAFECVHLLPRYSTHDFSHFFHVVLRGFANDVVLYHSFT